MKSIIQRKAWLRKLMSGIVDAVYPRTCPFCDRIIKRGQDICDECGPKLRYIEEPHCKKCGKQLLEDEREYCYDCSTTPHVYKEGMAVWAYNDMVSKSIYRFKYHNRRYYAKVYGGVMGKRCETTIKRWQADMIIPVPIHYRRMQRRGYNQAELIAKELGKLLDIPVDDRCLRRTRNTRAQKELNKSQRKKNIRHSNPKEFAASRYKR